ncbi:MAG: FAD-binding domain-containing protein [Pseudomonadota bacterium]
MKDLLLMRAAAIEKLEAFAPRMGRRYASGRNYDHGPGRHNAVSVLSPYVRRRIVTEEELVRAAVSHHGPDGAEKFIQEVVWRGYFKGWLERRPGIWTGYRNGVVADRAALEADRRLCKRVAAAEDGATGLDCFDAWVQELVETGYLHNHARMWFASIWIFTLGLPWRLGADFFLRHLLDGDPASNTLGWRWVAGLHTRGKAYEAKAWNIAKFTNQRFTPRDTDLADDIEPLQATEPEGLPPVSPLRDVHAPEPGVPTALLITEEDCCLDAFNPADLDLCATATLAASRLRSDLPTATGVERFETEALADAAARLDLTAETLSAGKPSDLAAWAQRQGARQIATAYIPQGPLRDWFDQAELTLQAAGIALTEWRRPWDELIWRHASAGFFKVKKQIPDILDRMEIA